MTIESAARYLVFWWGARALTCVLVCLVTSVIWWVRLVRDLR